MLQHLTAFQEITKFSILYSGQILWKILTNSKIHYTISKYKPLFTIFTYSFGGFVIYKTSSKVYFEFYFTNVKPTSINYYY